MRTLIARVFGYSFDGVIATEDTSFFDFCRELPDDTAQEKYTREFYEKADMHVMGRKHYQDAAQYFGHAAVRPGTTATARARVGHPVRQRNHRARLPPGPLERGPARTRTR
jgi:hypothetical protein